MFTQNQSEVKLEWMYKGAHSTVDREEYLLGKSVDKSLEQLNNQEKQQQLGIQPPKNHVEHECIPPSIRDYKEQLGEQVDINAKLQEDPLIAIKKREEENRRQFLNNPVQIKKLQEALKFQKSKRKGKHKNSDSDSEHEIDKKLAKKLKLLGKSNLVGKKIGKTSKKHMLDIILMHKYNQLKTQLTNNDIRDVLEGKKIETSSSSSESSDSEDQKSKHSKEKIKRDSDSSKPKTEFGRVTSNRSRYRRSPSSEVEKYKNKSNSTVKRSYTPSRNESRNRTSKYRRSEQTHESKNRRRSRSYSDSNKEPPRKGRRERSSSDSSQSSSDSNSKKKNWGLVRADGTKIPLVKSSSSHTSKEVKTQQISKVSNVKKRDVLTEEEKEKKRREMMENAFWRDKERAKNIKLYRDSNLKEDTDRKEYKPEFLKKELLKSANSSSVESRIKANINNIQRSGSDMSKHFSKRY